VYFPYVAVLYVYTVCSHAFRLSLTPTFLARRFEVIPITKDTKKEQEEKELELLKNDLKVDLVILACYMQIISDDFCRAFPHKVINIHHSFLPAFIGAKPYHRAYERGVKIIGATVRSLTAVFAIVR